MTQSIVGLLMTEKITCLRPEMSVRQAEEVLAGRRLSGAPVVDEAGRPIGVVSQHDLIAVEADGATAASTGRFYTDVEDYRDLATEPASHADEPIESVMSRDLVTIGRDARVVEAARMMREHRIHRLLVIEEDTLVGIVTSLDLLQAFEEPL